MQCYLRYYTSEIMMSSKIYIWILLYLRGDEFYSLFYLGLYTESLGEIDKAEKYMRAAVNTSYATGPGAGDYMTSVARVHCYLRNWN